MGNIRPQWPEDRATRPPMQRPMVSGPAPAPGAAMPSHPLVRPASNVGTNILLGLIALLLAGILGGVAFQVSQSQQPRYSANARAEIQQQLTSTDKALADLSLAFQKDVFRNTTAQSAVQQQVLELQYIYEAQLLVAKQQQAMLLVMLNG